MLLFGCVNSPVDYSGNIQLPREETITIIINN
jgi:hypothetical protein